MTSTFQIATTEESFQAWPAGSIPVPAPAPSSSTPASMSERLSRMYYPAFIRARITAWMPISTTGC